VKAVLWAGLGEKVGMGRRRKCPGNPANHGAAGRSIAIMYPGRSQGPSSETKPVARVLSASAVRTRLYDFVGSPNSAVSSPTLFVPPKHL